MERTALRQLRVARLLELLQSSRCKISGNSYIPEIEQNGAATELEWNLPETHATHFFVDIPNGLLAANWTGDTNYPGIAVNLKAADTDHHDVSLPLTEYIPSGEGISDYDPAHPTEMRCQSMEVPVERPNRRLLLFFIDKISLHKFLKG